MRVFAVLIAMLLVSCSGGQMEQSPPPQQAEGQQGSQPTPADAAQPAPLAETATAVPGDAMPPAAAPGAPAGEASQDWPAESLIDDAAVVAHAERPAQTASGPRVFTNKDLQAYGESAWGSGRSGRAAGSDPNGEEPPPEPEEENSRPRMSRQELGQYKAQVQEQITALTADLESLRKQAASLHNPFLPRATPNEQDAEAAAGKDGKQRLEYVNGRLEEVQRKLSEAKGRLDQLDAIKPVEPEPEPDAP